MSPSHARMRKVRKKTPKQCSPSPTSSSGSTGRPRSILRLAAVRRVAYEDADSGLLSPELAAGIRRVKGVRRLGGRLGNWLTPEQGRRLLTHRTATTLRELRDRAMLAVLIECGLRRGELLALQWRGCSSGRTIE